MNLTHEFLTERYSRPQWAIQFADGGVEYTATDGAHVYGVRVPESAPEVEHVKAVDTVAQKIFGERPAGE